MVRIRVNGITKTIGERPAQTSLGVSAPGANGPVEQVQNVIEAEASTAPVPMDTEPVPGPSSATTSSPQSETLIGMWKDAVEKVCPSPANIGEPTTVPVIRNNLEYLVNFSDVWEDKRYQPYLGKIKKALQRYTNITNFQVVAARKQASDIVRHIQQQCDYKKLYAFFRFDDFLCSVELRDRPYLARFPFGVVSHSVVQSVNKLARLAGVRINMTATQALQACPTIVLFPYKFGKYDRVMNAIKKILQEYDPGAKMTLDSAEICLIPNLDVSKVDEMDLVRQIKGRICDVTEMKCTAGIGPTTMIASLAAELCSPYGINLVKGDKLAADSFMNFLDLTKFGRLSTRTKVFLRVLNLCTATEILSNRLFLVFLCKKRIYYEIIGAALGIPTNSMRLRYIRSTKIPSVVSKKLNFLPVNDKELISQYCLSICNMLEKELRDMHVGGRLIMGHILTSGLNLKTKAHHMKVYTNRSASLYEATMNIINDIYKEDAKIMIAEIEIQVRELARGFDEEDAADMDGFIMPPPALTPRETRAHYRKRDTYTIYDLYYSRVPMRRKPTKNGQHRNPFVRGATRPFMICPNCEYKVDSCIPENCEIWMRYHAHICLRDIGPQKMNVNGN